MTASATSARKDFRDRLDERIRALAGDLAGLAHLRRSLSRPPGEAPEAWPYVVPLAGDHQQRFAAVALTLGLFALHQQGQQSPMHVRSSPEKGSNGTTVGSALAILRTRRPEAEAGLERRFAAVLSAQELAELGWHLRGLVVLLRGETVPLDYVRLCSDLLVWLCAERRLGVRRRWARDFYARVGPDDEADKASDTEGG